MTHNILQTDIELAKGLLAAQTPDAEIVGALVTRGIEPESARQLLDRLHSGAPEVVASSRPPTATAASATDSDPEHRRVRVRRRRSRGNRQRAAEQLWTFTAVGVCVVGLAAGFLLYKHKYHARTQFLLEQLDNSARAVETKKKLADKGEPRSSVTGGLSDGRDSWADDLDRYRALTNRIADRKLTDQEQAGLKTIILRLDRSTAPGGGAQ